MKFSVTPRIQSYMYMCFPNRFVCRYFISGTKRLRILQAKKKWVTIVLINWNSKETKKIWVMKNFLYLFSYISLKRCTLSIDLFILKWRIYFPFSHLYFLNMKNLLCNKCTCSLYTLHLNFANDTTDIIYLSCQCVLCIMWV